MQLQPPRVMSGRQQFFVKSGDGLMWMCDGNYAQDGYGPLHEQEPAGHSIHDYIMGSLPEGGVFLDIGAHVGHYTLRAARKGSHVYAVEANPDTAGRLLANLELNKIENVTVWAVAAWDSWDVLSLAPHDEAMRNGSQRVHRGGGQVTVAGMPLDMLLAHVPRVDTVKMDVEGADIRVLKGMHHALCRLKPKLIIEDHSVLGYFDPDELRQAEEYLTMEAGYKWQGAAEAGVRGKFLNYRIGTCD